MYTQEYYNKVVSNMLYTVCNNCFESNVISSLVHMTICKAPKSRVLLQRGLFPTDSAYMFVFVMLFQLFGHFNARSFCTRGHTHNRVF